MLDFLFKRFVWCKKKVGTEYKKMNRFGIKLCVNLLWALDLVILSYDDNIIDEKTQLKHSIDNLL